ncbi:MULTISPECIES: hypothetical protein [Listeria]|uniref:hypothetical protein n=1 Tax=Listeria TaxID=1637 RepID=UPI001FC93F1F|nr:MULTISPECIES: hypothetical protein [Listeria]
MARYYDPDQGDEDAPQKMNGYDYGQNNPVMHVDPDGHWVLPLMMAIKLIKKRRVGKKH